MACPSEIALMCRLCLLKDKQQVNIPIFEDHSDSKLLVKISALLPIKIFKEDQLPKNICDGCSDKLNLLYEFWNVSLESERTLLSWLKNDNLTISALAEPIEETIVKEEVEVEDESPYLDLAQHSSMDEFQEAEEEDVEEPPSKRPRRLAAMKAGISIATVSDDDNYEDGPQTEDVVKLEFESDENDNSEDIAKLENESDNDISSSVPENSTHESHDQPGPSGLGKSGTETPFMLKNVHLDADVENEIEESDIQPIDIKEIFSKEEDYSSDANPSRQDVLRKLECYICNAMFKTQLNLKNHLKTHSDMYPFECPTCKAKFIKKYLLKSHIITHSDIFPFECETCKAKFKRKADWKRHIITHSHTYPFECDTCKVKFRQECLLKSHILIHSDIYPLECETCKAKFKRKADLKRHIVIHSDIYPFGCNTCDAKFKQKVYLKNHMLKHLDIYPFECNTCKAKFKRKEHFKGHILRHSTPQSFECDICKAKFKWKHSLTKHKLAYSHGT